MHDAGAPWSGGQLPNGGEDPKDNAFHTQRRGDGRGPVLPRAGSLDDQGSGGNAGAESY